MSQFAVVNPKTGRIPAGYYYDGSGGPAARASRLAGTTTTTAAVTTRPATAPLNPTGSTSGWSSSAWMCKPPEPDALRRLPGHV
jgi:hypothetical protein